MKGKAPRVWGVAGSGQGQTSAQQLEQALGVVEVVGAGNAIPARRLGRARQEEAQSRPFPRRCIGAAVAIADLEDGDIGTTLPFVEGQDVEQAADQLAAQDGVLRGKRVRNRDRIPDRRLREGDTVVIGRPSQPGLVQRRDKGVGDDFCQPGAHESVADELTDPQRRWPVGRHQRVGQMRRSGLVATNTGHLLRHVGLDNQVPAPGRHHRDERFLGTRVDDKGLWLDCDLDAGARRGRFCVHVYASQKAALLVCGNRRAEQLPHAGGPEGQLCRGRLLRRSVDATFRDRTAGPGERELRDPICPDAGETELLALLEAKARFGPQGVPMAGPTDADRIEHGGLDCDLGRRIRDLAVGPAHHTGDADRAAGIRNDQGVGRQLALDVIEGLEAFPGKCEPDDDRPFLDRGSVERVRRLAQFEHHVVRRVDDIAHRAHARGLESHLDPIRRRPDLHATHPPAHEPGAELRLANLNAQPVAHWTARFLDRDLGPPDLGAGRGRDLTRQADQAQRVAAIRLDVHVEDDVAVQLAQVSTKGRRRRQDQDPLGVAGDVQFITRAQHAFRNDAHLLGAFDAALAG